MAILDLILQYVVLILVVVGLVLLARSPQIQVAFRQALDLVWRKKYLWFIGALAGLGAYGGEANFFARKIDSASLFDDLLSALRDSVIQGQAQRIWDIVRNAFSSAPMQMSAILIGILALFVLVLWLVLISQGALTRIAVRFAEKKPASFFDGVATSSARLWDIFRLSLIFFLIGWGVWVVVAGLPSIISIVSGNDAWRAVAKAGSYVSLVVGVINLFLLHYAFVEMFIGERVGAVPAIARAWAVLRRNFLFSIEIALSLFVANIIALVVIAAVLVFFVFPGNLTNLVVDVVVLFILLGFLTSFSYGVTASLYLRMREQTPVGKLGQWTEKIVNLSKKSST